MFQINMNCITKATLFLALIFGLNYSVSAQISTGGLNGSADSLNVITTAVPFLRISPDSRSAGMGDAGIAISSDANSIYWNPAKLVFNEHKSALAVNFCPWLSALGIKDMYLADLSGFMKLTKTQALGASFKYFAMGEIKFTDGNGAPNGQSKPNEFAFSLAYSRALSNKFSTGLGLKFLRSDLARGQIAQGSGEIKAGYGAAADISAYYNNEINDQSSLTAGLVISNLGNKIKYTDNNDTRDFMPINLGFGVAYTRTPSEHHKITATIDINKLMVPTPSNIDDDLDGVIDSREKPVISGMFGSFSDAPNGSKEELRELMYSFGAEYWYDNQFALRAGYYTEHATKGNRKFATLGAGVRFKMTNINLSYLIPVNNSNSPLANTFRVSFLFNFRDYALAKDDQ